MLVISIIRRLRQEFKASLGDIKRPCLKNLNKIEVNKTFLCFSQELYFICYQLGRLTSSSCCVFKFMNVVCFPIYFDLLWFLHISVLLFFAYKSYASFIRFISCHCAEFLFQFQEVFCFVFIVFGVFYIDKIFWIICIIIQSEIVLFCTFQPTSVPLAFFSALADFQSYV